MQRFYGKYATSLRSSLAEVPERQLHDVLNEMRDGEFLVRISNPGVDDLAHHIDVSVNRIAVSLVILSLALRAFAVCREKPAQQDLPFEDSPLEV